MCFELDSLPPIPVISGGEHAYERLVLKASDGNEFNAFFAPAEEPSSAGVVILPDVRGLYRFYEALALRFAERGYPALAMDYFGRTAGLDERDEDFDHMAHVRQVEEEGLQADIAASVAYLRERGAMSIFTVGFCFGGSNSWFASTGGHGLAGSVGFYGRPPLEEVPNMANPILALQAGDDANISAEDNATFDKALTDAGVEHEIVTFEGAPHSFFDRKQEDFAEASADAWRRTLEFIERYRAE